MVGHVSLHAEAQDVDDRVLLAHPSLEYVNAPIAIGDLDLATLQGFAPGVQLVPERLDAADQVERDGGKVERGVALMNPAFDLIECGRHVPTE